MGGVTTVFTVSGLVLLASALLVVARVRARPDTARGPDARAGPREHPTASLTEVAGPRRSGRDVRGDVRNVIGSAAGDSPGGGAKTAKGARR